MARPFDAARMDLWFGEATGDARALDRAAAAFAKVGARPYLLRAKSSTS